MSEKWYERLDRLAGKEEGGGRDKYLRENVELAHRLKCPVRTKVAGATGVTQERDEVDEGAVQLTPKRVDYLIGGGRQGGRSRFLSECGYTYYPALQEEENALQPADQAGRGD